MSTERRQPGQDGFTLVEVLVAALVLVIGILAVLAVFVTAFRTSNTAERNEVMAREAEHQLEGMRGNCYGGITLSQTPPGPADPTDLDDPLAHVQSGKLVVEDGSNPEELVTAAEPKKDGDGCTDADGDGRADGGIAPTGTVTIGSGSAAITGRVFRFVSWRDEECPVVDLARLNQLVTDVRTLLAETAGPDGTLTGLVGTNGTLKRAISDAKKAKNTAEGGLLNLLLRPTLETILSVLNPLLSDALSPLDAQLSPLLAPLQSSIPELQTLQEQLTQRVDLCDLPKLVDVRSLESMHAALQQLAPVVAAAQTPVQGVAPILASLAPLDAAGLVAAVDTVLTIPPYTTAIEDSVAQLDTTLAAIKGDAASPAARLTTLSEDIAQAAQMLSAEPHTERNSKRLTVAVVLDERNGLGPFKPFWASTILTDPKDGLL